MKITEIRLDVAKTINMGDYSSLRIGAGLTISVPEGADVAALRDEAHHDLSLMITEAWQKHRRGE